MEKNEVLTRYFYGLRNDMVNTVDHCLCSGSIDMYSASFSDEHQYGRKFLPLKYAIGYNSINVIKFLVTKKNYKVSGSDISTAYLYGMDNNNRSVTLNKEIINFLWDNYEPSAKDILLFFCCDEKRIEDAFQKIGSEKIINTKLKLNKLFQRQIRDNHTLLFFETLKKLGYDLSKHVMAIGLFDGKSYYCYTKNYNEISYYNNLLLLGISTNGTEVNEKSDLFSFMKDKKVKNFEKLSEEDQIYAKMRFF